MEATYLNLDGGDSQRGISSRAFKAGILVGLIGGCSLVLLGVAAISSPTLNSTSAAESTSLFGLPTTSLHSGLMPRPMQPWKVLSNELPGGGPWKDLALATMQEANQCSRDVSMSATANAIQNVMASMSSADKAVVAKADATVRATAADKLSAGNTAPFGFWDPFGLSTDISEGRLLFYREAEIKHGRVCMLAFLGMLVGEKVHPLLGGDIGPIGATHFTAVPPAGMAFFWKLAFLQNIAAITYLEVTKSMPTIGITSDYKDLNSGGQDVFAMKETSRLPGDLGFDPLGLKPKTDADLLNMQNKEILNGRLAMIAAIGALAQEGYTGERVFR